MPVFNIHHITKYEYDRPIKESNNEIKIFPLLCHEQETLQHEVIISHQPDIHFFVDYWGNKTGLFNVLPVHQQMVIESKLTIRTTLSSQLQFNFHTNWQQLQDEVNFDLRLIELSNPDATTRQQEIKDMLSSIITPDTSVATAVEQISQYIFKQFKYIKGITTIETTVDEILDHRSGVCQDFAHVMLQMLKTLQIPCRYVSGYICPNKNGMRGEGATHAWVEVWLPQYGWAGIDPTNNVWVTNHHVKLAVGRHFNDCSPVKGTFKGPARQKLSVFVAVGYEDGQKFEEVTNVQLESQPIDAKDNFFISDGYEVQQQQQ
jgi:transglutaminase-like putative cysteine protease